MTNGLLLMSHMNNVRFYDMEDGVKTGFYTLYELEQAFVNAGKSKKAAVLAHTMCRTSLFDAYKFSDGICEVKDEFKQYVTNDIHANVRSKTISRGALYNGMNPDNDMPQAKNTTVGTYILSMRGWLTQAAQHLLSGGTDNVIRNRRKETVYKTRYGVTKKKEKWISDDISNQDKARRMSWNYETSTPHDQIFVGIYRSFCTFGRILRKEACKGLTKVSKSEGVKKYANEETAKFSYVEKYAWRDAIIYFAFLSAMLLAWPLLNERAKQVPPPTEKEEVFENFISNEYYWLMMSNIGFRIIESSITSVDPSSAMDVVTTITTLKSAFDEQFGLVNAAMDLFGFSGHTLDE